MALNKVLQLRQLLVREVDLTSSQGDPQGLPDVVVAVSRVLGRHDWRSQVHVLVDQRDDLVRFDVLQPEEEVFEKQSQHKAVRLLLQALLFDLHLCIACPFLGRFLEELGCGCVDEGSRERCRLGFNLPKNFVASQFEHGTV